MPPTVQIEKAMMLPQEDLSQDAELQSVTSYLLDRKDPQRVALSLIDGDYSYGELTNAARCVAGHLILSGAAKGDRILLIADNSFFWVVSYLGILQAGLVCVALPAGTADSEISYIVQTTSAKVAFLPAIQAARSKQSLKGLHLVTDRNIPQPFDVASHSDLSSILANDHNLNVTLPAIFTNDLAALAFTSGSTGKPRGVMVSHGNIIANTNSIIEYLRLTSDDRIMAVLPFCYCFGTSLLHTHLRVGGTVVVDSRFMYPEKVLQRMIDTRCTGFAGVPSHFQLLLRSSSLPRKQFPDLRYVQQAGGHLAPAFITELRQALPTTKVFVMYGQTEATARLSYLSPEFLDTKLGSIGKGIPGVKLTVTKPDGVPARPGQVGEIVAEGKNVTLGYWQAPAETAKSFCDGKLHTGDLATVDADGFIYIVDRASDFIKCRGKRISCQQIEDQMLGLNEVLEVAVIGIPDEVLGEAVKAFVVPRNGNASGLAERLQQFCKQNVPLELHPKEIVVMSSLPKNNSGKVQKRSLKQS
jgi:long-chain acyl-CoA synthetase